MTKPATTPSKYPHCHRDCCPHDICERCQYSDAIPCLLCAVEETDDNESDTE
jgi:hypothetical protein